jgi:APA family basic amino acid/polyamine antiporter
VTSGGSLERRLGVADAVVIGAGSMIGAGVFVAWSPAAEAAGTGLIIGLVIAGVVAFCNAASSAQLAAVHPESGGTYVYGRRQLGAFWGHLAGWGFVVGKTASCAAMALTVGAYLWPEQDRTVAVAAVVGITAVNIGGLSRTVAVTRVLLVVSVSALVAVVVAGWSSSDADLDRIVPIDGDAYGVLQSAGFLFFAFAGYARIATLGEEVKDPEVTIPGCAWLPGQRSAGTFGPDFLGVPEFMIKGLRDPAEAGGKGSSHEPQHHSSRARGAAHLLCGRSGGVRSRRP